MYIQLQVRNFICSSILEITWESQRMAYKWLSVVNKQGDLTDKLYGKQFQTENKMCLHKTAEPRVPNCSKEQERKKKNCACTQI